MASENEPGRPPLARSRHLYDSRKTAGEVPAAGHGVRAGC